MVFKANLVEISGIEPLTSWMPFKRSPSWAIPPYSVAVRQLLYYSTDAKKVNRFFKKLSALRKFFGVPDYLCAEAAYQTDRRNCSHTQRHVQKRTVSRDLIISRMLSTGNCAKSMVFGTVKPRQSPQSSLCIIFPHLYPVLTKKLIIFRWRAAFSLTNKPEAVIMLLPFTYEERKNG